MTPLTAEQQARKDEAIAAAAAVYAQWADEHPDLAYDDVPVANTA